MWKKLWLIVIDLSENAFIAYSCQCPFPTISSYFTFESKWKVLPLSLGLAVPPMCLKWLMFKPCISVCLGLLRELIALTAGVSTDVCVGTGEGWAMAMLFWVGNLLGTQFLEEGRGSSMSVSLQSCVSSDLAAQTRSMCTCKMYASLLCWGCKMYCYSEAHYLLLWLITAVSVWTLQWYFGFPSKISRTKQQNIFRELIQSM